MRASLPGGDGLADEAMQGVGVAERDRDPDGSDDVAGGLEALQGGLVLEETLVDGAGPAVLAVVAHGGGGGGVLARLEETLDLDLDAGIDGRRRRRIRRRRRRSRRRRHRHRSAL